MAKKKPKNKADRDHMALAAQVPCLACEQMGIETLPVELHHPRRGAGIAQRSNHKEVLSLCHSHHRTGGYGVALHAGQIAFERRYGTEAQMLAIQLEHMEEIKAMTV